MAPCAGTPQVTHYQGTQGVSELRCYATVPGDLLPASSPMSRPKDCGNRTSSGRRSLPIPHGTALGSKAGEFQPHLSLGHDEDKSPATSLCTPCACLTLYTCSRKVAE